MQLNRHTKEKERGREYTFSLCLWIWVFFMRTQRSIFVVNDNKQANNQAGGRQTGQIKPAIWAGEQFLPVSTLLLYFSHCWMMVNPSVFSVWMKIIAVKNRQTANKTMDKQTYMGHTLPMHNLHIHTYSINLIGKAYYSINSTVVPCEKKMIRKLIPSKYFHQNRWKG